ncbi:hypothetical protein [Taibaiella koreensis]|uniref:hypothetical protein n=1 Tax=Taibaiella koreensis TaxID=1268548 RepID=UPI0013C2EDEE|nr:hypothetical protein [Taibaiella koreensis]
MGIEKIHTPAINGTGRNDEALKEEHVSIEAQIVTQLNSVMPELVQAGPYLLQKNKERYPCGLPAMYFRT